MTATDPAAIARAEAFLRSRRYVVLLLIAAILGAVISAVSYAFLAVAHEIQVGVYTDLPERLGFGAAPVWWPLGPLLLAGLIVGVVVRYLPGAGGRMPVDGFQAGEQPAAAYLPGIALAALGSIALGPVVGPEAPLIAIGAGLAVALVRWTGRELPEQTTMIFAATGSFAAISTLLGSPIVGAFLIMEISGLTGVAASVVLVPGLLGAGIGALVFTGLDQLTGKGVFSLAIPDLPAAHRPTGAEFGWALAIGVAAAVLCWLIRRGAGLIRPAIERYRVPATIVAALAIAGLAIGYDAATSHAASDVLFSGQDQLPDLIEHASTYSVGALLLLIVAKGLAYSMSLVGFRGGPTFPAMFLGAVGGIAMSHLPGLPMVTGAAVGIGTMTVAMLRLPLTSVLLTTLFLGSDGILVMPVVIVAVVVSHVISVRLTPLPAAS